MIKPYPYTVKTLLPKVEQILQNSLTVDLISLLKEKTIDGLSSLSYGDVESARMAHAEAFGAHNLWLKTLFDDITDLDGLSRDRLDNHVFEYLRHLDEAIVRAQSV